MERKYVLTGWPAVILCLVPMVVGWFEIVKLVVTGLL